MTAIYAIVNNVNGHQYVGSSRSTARRFTEHRKMLRAGRHPSRHLQAAWNHYGEREFEFLVVTSCAEHDLIATEQSAIDSVLRDCGRKALYNSSLTAHRPDWSEESRQLLRDKRFKEQNPFWGKQHSAESRAKMSQSQRGHRAWNKGKPATPEHREAIAKAGLGRVPSPETRAKRSATMKRLAAEGKIFTPQHLANICAAQRRRRDREQSTLRTDL